MFRITKLGCRKFVYKLELFEDDYVNELLILSLLAELLADIGEVEKCYRQRTESN